MRNWSVVLLVVFLVVIQSLSKDPSSLLEQDQTTLAMKTTTLIWASFFLLAGCDTNNPDIPNPLAGSDWTLASVWDTIGTQPQQYFPLPSQPQEFSAISFRDSLNVVGWNNCKRIEAQYRLDTNNRIRFFDIRTPISTCPSSLEIAPDLVSLLQEPAIYEFHHSPEGFLSDSLLSLSNEYNQKVFFYRIDWHDEIFGAPSNGID